MHDVLKVCMDVIKTDDMEVRSISSILKVLRRIILISPISGIP